MSDICPLAVRRDGWTWPGAQWLTMLVCWLLWVPSAQSVGAEEQTTKGYMAGVAKVDITPDYPIRLSGFGGRREESDGVRQQIWAKALAIGADPEPVVLVTVDAIGIPNYLTEEVAARLQKKSGLPRERFAICATHSHTAPCLSGMIRTLFGVSVPKDHQEHIDRYTRELTDKLEQVAQKAMAARSPAQLEFAVGNVDFAINRRTKGGPVDHDLSMLRVTDADGKLRAVYVNYACHCVVLSDNKISGDWAGFAQSHIEKDHPGAVALVAVGCGADSNPASGVTGDKADIAEQYGLKVAREVDRLLKTTLQPVSGRPACKFERVDLPLADLPTREEWTERSKKPGAVGYHAQVQLERLDRGESLASKVSYPIQSWQFGKSLAMGFLPGEVVVDYSLRLKRELDRGRLWINAYANDCPCYIPSERILKEGGYEGGDAMVYYDLPTKFAPGLEEKIVSAVHDQLDEEFKAAFDTRGTQGIPPLRPMESLAAMHVKDGFQVELVVAEPLVVDPVAIDFGADGRLWVAEMHDYPSGLGGGYEPGGRVRVLEDTQMNGKFDKSTIFLDNIPFPTGVTCWRNGVLVCAAPDILYAEDTDGDGKADKVQKLFSGFGTENYQARVNSLAYGLDNWVYGSCGLFGGTITSELAHREYALGDRDFRIHPDTGELEPATGRTQQGRVRDDWGNWFGCDNSTLAWHYPLADEALRRNPHLAAPASAVPIADADATQLYPLGNLVRFALSGEPGRPTAACGIGIYRDGLLGAEYSGNVFVCEPVNQLVHRMILRPSGATYDAKRADDEQKSEFLASTDNWFRPVQVRTGPDGALWVVDMYRYVIEHPRWIPAETLAHLDVRAGNTMGRIYRVYPQGKKPRPIIRLDRLVGGELAAALDSPNGPQRDTAQQQIVWRRDISAVAVLEELARSSRPATRLQALGTLDGLHSLADGAVIRALTDEHPGVRCNAVRLSEGRFGNAEIAAKVVDLVNDDDPQVALQVACSLGNWSDPRAAEGLASLALRHADDSLIITAVLSSINVNNVPQVCSTVFGTEDRAPDPELARRLAEMAGALVNRAALGQALSAAARGVDRKLAAWQLLTAVGLLESSGRQKQPLDQLLGADGRHNIDRLVEYARAIALDEAAELACRVASAELLGLASQFGHDVALSLGQLLGPEVHAQLQRAAIDALARIEEKGCAAQLLSHFDGYTPEVRTKVLDVLLARPGTTRELLSSIESGVVPANQIDAAHRQQLLEHQDQRLRALAVKVLAQGSAGSRRTAVERYQAAAEISGDAARGRAAFEKSCAACHQLSGLGHVVGPDLTALKNKSPQALLEAILDPNVTVDQRYANYVAVTNDGRILQGILADETATSVTLKAQQGELRVLLRSDLESLRSTGKSLMPEGLENDISLEQMADLMAFVGSLGEKSAQ